jgi:molecular chaperone GrpE (heat shock protein)
MSEPEETAETESTTVIIDPVAFLEQLSEVQYQLREDFERLAAAVTPLLTKQYRDTEVRIRVLETRLRNRQERPLIVRMANLLSDVRRIESAEDVKIHVEETILDVLTSVGYQEMGAEGDQFDPGFHEPLSGSAGRASVVTRVHRRGLACYGDVIIKAKVDVKPNVAPETEQGELQT